jgi:hypothetical protein
MDVHPPDRSFPDTGVRALPDELVDRMFHPRLASSRPPKREPAPDDESVPTERKLRRRSRELELEAALGWESLPEPPQPKTKAGPDYDALRQQFADEMLALLTLSDEQAAANEG